jgi:hypothetical protein
MLVEFQRHAEEYLQRITRKYRCTQAGSDARQELSEQSNS